jgi:GT2 family glycosyltransferase
MVAVAICVCTRKRPDGIVTLLESLGNMQVPPETEVRVVVVENDSAPYTEETIKRVSKKSTLTIDYYLEKQAGISYARNRTVREAGKVDFCCFVDDDQSVDKNWLVELLRCQEEFDTEGVWLTNPPVFNKLVPYYVERFHLPEIYSYGEEVKQAYTNCLMLKKTWLDKIEGPFDVRLNFTGGEDCYLTKEVIAKGGSIRFTPYAKAHEIVPSDRTTLKYMMKRTSRTINTKFILQAMLDENFSKYSLLPRLFLRLCNGLLLTVPYFMFSRTNKYLGLLKISDAVGGMLFVFGQKNKFYKLK